MANTFDNILEIKELNVNLEKKDRTIGALKGINLAIKKGERVALVGESGSGKTMLSLSILKLLEPPLKIESGEIVFKGRDLLKLKEKEIEKIRGKEISMIFQEPLTALNPVLTIGFQVAEPFLIHQNISKKEAFENAERLLKMVSIRDVKRVMKSYPHQLSGGMRQRAMIAMALALNPDLLLADEPTTALDVTLQSQFLDLLKNLQKKFSLSLLIITHDFGVVAEIAERVVVLYGGMVFEEAGVENLFDNPLQPYTKSLLSSIPKRGTRGRLKTIRGQVPPLEKFGSGCPFKDRCDFALDECSKSLPPLKERESGHKVACFLYGV